MNWNTLSSVGGFSVTSASSTKVETVGRLAERETAALPRETVPLTEPPMRVPASETLTVTAGLSTANHGTPSNVTVGPVSDSAISSVFPSVSSVNCNAAWRVTPRNNVVGPARLTVVDGDGKAGVPATLRPPEPNRAASAFGIGSEPAAMAPGYTSTVPPEELECRAL